MYNPMQIFIVTFFWNVRRKFFLSLISILIISVVYVFKMVTESALCDTDARNSGTPDMYGDGAIF